ncbi:T9SS type A sorting domain-containing protein [Neolewinella aurantiaca]|uniref:T9SS type A sorting domain-containing protein n=1 Tax=Neolewinella aurantiaca TaxID=2602767 RepID=A0A5C7FV61_9BACT|nr:alkaline phosphatase D family protein [Neolewinella aurantiaca]TXF90539.1 T9SS type A sorting domain-containing protein [Neolewinella aurantiaca]
MRPFYSLFTVVAVLFSFCASAQTDQPNSFGKGGTLIQHDRPFRDAAAKSFNEGLAPFFHGVASGDPLEDRVIIWTRVTPETMDGSPVSVEWRMATDTALTEIVATGSFTTSSSRDYTVKVDVTGLESGTTYYYGFTAFGANSLTGKTKTTPTADAVDHLKFGVVSCSNYQAGYFNAYGALAARTDLDAIIHLGDYLYEYADFVYGSDSIWADRQVEPSTEIVSLFDYRARYSTYRLDTNLQRLHQQHPIIAVWDDHETANDAYSGGAENHQPDTEGDWDDRLNRARKAYFEWLPIRDNGEQRVYRSISYGDIADLIMLDTRIEGRDQQINDIEDPALYAADRTILGAEQKSWLFDQLSSSAAKWKVVGQQVIFSEFNVGWAGAATGASFQQTENLFLDIWDGYPAERQEVVDYISDNEIDNVVLLTGDFHSSFAFDVAQPPVDLQFREVPGVGTLPFYDPSPNYNPTTGEGSVAVEFATPSINSANFDENIDPATAFGLQAQINNPIVPAPGISLGNPNPHMKYVELVQHGYFILDIKEDSVQADYHYLPILTDSINESFGRGMYTLNGENHLNAATGPTAPKTVQDVPAPLAPPALVSAVANPDQLPGFRVLSVYPNPASEFAYLHYGLNKTMDLNISLVDINGRVVKKLEQSRKPAGLYTLASEVTDLPSGTYFYRIASGNHQSTQVLIRK